MSKTESTAVISVEELIKRELANSAGRLASSGSNKIKLTDKKFTFPDGTEVKGKPIEVVIVSYINANTLYNGPYNPKNVAPPLCSAVGIVLADMKPRASTETPVNADCASCPKNQWGSGSGNGKACGNKVLVAVLKPDDLAGDMYTIEVSATAIKDFTKYTKGLENAGKTLPMMVTEVSFSDDSFPSVRFKPAAHNPDIAGAYGRQEEAVKMLQE